MALNALPPGSASGLNSDSNKLSHSCVSQYILESELTRSFAVKSLRIVIVELNQSPVLAHESESIQPETP